MNYWRNTLSAAVLCLAALVPAAAQQDPFAVFNDIDDMMQDNVLMDAANRHASAVLTFLPERATVIGYESANSQLNARNASQEKAAQKALDGIKTSMAEMDLKEFSPAKEADFNVMLGRINYDLWSLSRNRLALDPLYYTQAFNSVYDLMLKKLSAPNVQNEALAARASALGRTAKEAKANLKNPSAFLSQLAMERAYYAYLSFDDVTKQLNTTAEDTVSRQETAVTANQARRNLKEMFEFFKKLSQAEETPDFRLGEEDYRFVLQNKYFINTKPEALRKELTKQFKQVRENLFFALEPFTAAQDPEVVTVDGSSAPVSNKKNKKRKISKHQPLPTAADFYAVRGRLALDVPANINLLASIKNQAQSLEADLVQKNVLPKNDVSFNIKPMPAYFAYMTPYLFVPPYGTQNLPTFDFFVRMPSGNKVNRAKMLEQDFNEPARKLMIAGQLVPGRYYKSVYGQNASPIRKRYPVPTLANGWSVYAQHLAADNGFIITDTDLLFLAWEDYRRVVSALVDLNLQTRQFSYADALTFLVQANDFEKEEAEAIIKASALNPGEAVSYTIGFETLSALHKKYQKKYGKHFDEADFHAKIMSIGNVAPGVLEEELAAAYKK